MAENRGDKGTFSDLALQIEDMRNSGLDDQSIQSLLSSGQLNQYESFTDFMTEQTKLGLADTIFGKEGSDDDITLGGFASEVPGAIGSVATDILQAIPRAAVTLGATGIDAVTGNEGDTTIPVEDPVSKFFLGDQPIKSLQTSTGEFFEFADSTGLITESEDTFLPPLAAFLGTAAVVTDPLNPSKKGFVKAIANSTDANFNFNTLKRNTDGFTDAQLKELADKMTRIDNEKGIENVIRQAGLQNKVRNVTESVQGRVPDADSAKVAQTTNEILSQGGKVSDDGFVDLFVYGDKKALDAAKKTGQLNDLSIAVARANVAKNTPVSKVKVPTEKIDFGLDNTLRVLDNNVNFTTRRSSFEKKVDDALNITKSKQDSFEVKQLKDRIKLMNTAGKTASKAKAKEISDVQSQLVKMVNQLPLKERGKMVSAIKNTTNTKKLNAQAERVLDNVAKFELLKRELRNKGSLRSNLAYLKKAGEFNQTMVSDVKKDLGIDKPISKMSLEELQKTREAFRERLQFKSDRGYLKKDDGSTSVPDEVYREIEERAGEPKQSFKESVKDIYRNPRDATSRFDKAAFSSMSLTLRRISPKIAGAVRRMEAEIKVDTGRYYAVLSSLEKGFKVMTKQDRAVMSAAMLNGDMSVYNRLASKYSLEKEMGLLRKALDQSHDNLKEVGYDLGYKKNYFPRMISDRKGLMEYFKTNEKYKPIHEGIKELEAKLGRVPTDLEITKMMNTLFRGYKTNNVTLSLGSIGEERIIDVIDADLAKYYHDPVTSLGLYFSEASEKFHLAKLLGKMGKGVNLDKLEDTIGSITLDLYRKGEITEENMQMLSRALIARANYTPSSGAIQTVKSLSYIQVLNDPGNTLTQFGDFWMSIYHHGARNSAVALKNKALSKNEYDTYTLGINQISEEMVNKGYLNWATDQMFKWTGFRAIDFLAKETYVNAAVLDYRKAVKKGKGRAYDNFKQRMGDLFDEAEMKQLEADLKAGEDSELVRLMAVTDILRTQPIAKSEMPISYLEHPNGRILYTLKTWGIKQLSHMREEALEGARRGDSQVSIALNVASIAGGMAAMGAGMDEIKDWMYGRENSVVESFIDNLLQFMFLSRYDGYTLENSGVGGLIANKVLPPQPVFQAVYRDIKQENEKPSELHSVRYLPFVGDLYYYRSGRGADKKAEETSRDDSSRVRDKDTRVRDKDTPTRDRDSSERVRDK